MATAIKMETGDHRKFISTGSSQAAKTFRLKEASLMKQGKFMEAFDENVKEIRKQFGNKYDAAIKKARAHYVKDVLPELKKQYNSK